MKEACLFVTVQEGPSSLNKWQQDEKNGNTLRTDPMEKQALQEKEIATAA